MSAPAPAPRQDALDLDGVARPVDDEVADLLAGMVSDPANVADRERIVRAVLAEGRSQRGRVDQNRVRARLTDPDSGRLVVKPQLVGSVVSMLRRTGALLPHSWGTNEDRASGNGGKPLRVYVLAPALLRRRGGAP